MSVLVIVVCFCASVEGWCGECLRALFWQWGNGWGYDNGVIIWCYWTASVRYHHTGHDHHRCTRAHNNGILEHSPRSRWRGWKRLGGTCEAVLLAAVLQLSKLLAMCTGGAAGTWRQLRRRRWEVRQGRIGGRGGNAAQQWWRQLRNYVHQQRCGWVKGNKKASAEELQGAAAEDAALEVAATPLAKAKGGTNGWNGNRASCCKR